MTDPGDNIAELAAVTEIEAPTAVQGKAAFTANIREGWRMACLCRPNPEALRFSWGQLLALVTLNWLINFSAQVAYVGFDGSFQVDAVPDSLFLMPELVLAWLLALVAKERSGDADAVGAYRYLVALFSMGVPLSLAYLLYLLAYSRLTNLNPWLQWGLAYSPLAWYILAAVLAAIRLFGLRGGQRLAALIAVVALLLAPQFLSNHDRWLWLPRYSASDEAAGPREDYFASVREENIYRQSQLLDEALAQLQPGRPGLTDLYFVGAAGYAPQDVFMKEVNSVARLFDERFGTEGRSLKLINNAATIKDVPIASRTALQRALGRIAELMNDEDILFLYMTSHGSKDHKFSLDFGMMRFDDIDPSVLRKLLDDAGIKHRVIVVSACYSGGFVDPLKSDDTLVITAAAADRNSFGCSNENDYTYFGKAYFDEALRKTYSFVEAFNLAMPVIAEREKKENYTPSSPQIAIGKDIAPLLDAYAEELQKQGLRGTVSSLQ